MAEKKPTIIKVPNPNGTKLIEKMSDKDGNLTLTQFKDGVLELFSDIMRSEEVDIDTQGKIARLRARIEIELKQII